MKMSTSAAGTIRKKKIWNTIQVLNLPALGFTYLLDSCISALLARQYLLFVKMQCEQYFHSKLAHDT